VSEEPNSSLSIGKVVGFFALLFVLAVGGAIYAHWLILLVEWGWRHSGG
jgi:hypothetical protein